MSNEGELTDMNIYTELSTEKIKKAWNNMTPEFKEKIERLAAYLNCTVKQEANE